MSERTYYTKQTKYGNLRSDSPPKMMLYNFGAGAYGIIAIIGFLMLFGEDLRMFGVGAIAVGGGCAWFLLHAKKTLLAEYEKFLKEVREEEKKEEAAAAQYRKEHPYPEAEELFIKAREAGIPDVDSKVNVSRLALFAKNHNIAGSSDELIKQFNLGKQYVERHETNDRLSKLHAQEKELFEKYTLYANCENQDKSIRICQDKIREANQIIFECEQDEASVRNGGEATYMLGRQRESSWAVHGGIASGIAGGAAGLAVAANVERRNQEKRQQNADLAKSIAMSSVMRLNKIWDRKHNAESDVARWTAKLEEAKVLLSEKQNQKELLAMLHPCVEKVEISETGAVKLKVKLHSTPNLIIFDDVKAVVDGSIQVLLKVENEVVGSAVCVLPYGGMSSYATVNAICCRPKKQAQEYTFAFAPIHLWAVETKESVFDSWGYEQRAKAKELEDRKAQQEGYKNSFAKECLTNTNSVSYHVLQTLMQHPEGLSVGDIQKYTPFLADCSTQQIRSDLRRMVDNGLAIRYETKKEAMFKATL